MRDKQNAGHFVSIISTILVIGLAIYLGTLVKSVDTIEEKLSHQAQKIERVSLLNDEAIDGVQRSYVPVYSHIYSEGGKAVLLETTLVSRKPDPKNAIKVHSVDYSTPNG